MNQECTGCPYRGQCDMQCWGPANVYWEVSE